MSPFLWLLFGLSVACDMGGQLCFKRGVHDIAVTDGQGAWARQFALYFNAVARAPWLWGGIAVYAVELVIWLAILERAPLSLAFPIASLNYCGVMIACHLLLKEHVSRRRWIGAAFITLGVAIVGLGAEG